MLLGVEWSSNPGCQLFSTQFHRAMSAMFSLITDRWSDQQRGTFSVALAPETCHPPAEEDLKCEEQLVMGTVCDAAFQNDPLPSSCATCQAPADFQEDLGRGTEPAESTQLPHKEPPVGQAGQGFARFTEEMGDGGFDQVKMTVILFALGKPVMMECF